MPEELVTDLWDNLVELSTHERYLHIADIAESIKESGGKSFSTQMIISLNELCNTYNICPECGSELINRKFNEIHTELDNNDKETIYQLHCPSCGWVED